MRVNALATEARNDYRDRPYWGETEPGWMSGGFSVHRDSDALERSNHRMALKTYEAAGVEYTVDGFNHWAVGWINHVSLRITPRAIATLEELRDQIESYPVLDEEDMAEIEWSDDHPSEGECYSSRLEDYGEPCPCGRGK